LAVFAYRLEEKMNTPLQKTIALILVLVMAALACAPLDFAVEILGAIATASVTWTPSPTPDTESADWYVATDGNNSNTCATPADPCLTLQQAIRKSTPFDIIHVAAGTYPATGSDFALIQHQLLIMGAGRDATIFDGGGSMGGFRLYDGVDATIQNLTIQNTTIRSADAAIHVAQDASAYVENVRLDRCIRQCVLVAARGTLNMVDVEISNATDEHTGSDFILNGYGLVSAGRVTAERVQIHGSAHYGVSSTGSLLFTDVQINNNGTTGVEIGGGIATFNDVTINNNGADLPRLGLFILAGSVEMFDSEVAFNNREAIGVQPGANLTLVRVNIHDNRGNGISIRETAHVEISNSTIENNLTDGEFGAGIANYGELVMDTTRVLRNRGIGVYNIGTGTIEMVDSQVTDHPERGIYNQDETGIVNLNRVLVARNNYDQGALLNFGTMTLTNVTIANNIGPGLRVDQNTVLNYVTVTDNTGGGLNVGGPGPISIHNSLFARNPGGDCVLPLFGVSTSGLNFDTDGSCSLLTTTTVASLRLGSLADNGGFSNTVALMDGSAAIDTATGACPSEDQRGPMFARPVGAGCDVGAYEAGATAPPPEAIVIASETPEDGDQPDIITIDVDLPCYAGPGPQWQTYTTLKAGTKLRVAGYGFGGGWIVTYHPDTEQYRCWLDENRVDLLIPVDELKLIAIPPKPTATPQPTKQDRPTAEPTRTCGPNEPNCAP
jgi:hypothetical protein